MNQRPIDRRQLLRISAVAAAAASVASRSTAQSTREASVLGYDLPNEPTFVADLETFLETGRYTYEWDGKKSPSYPNGSHEIGEVVVSQRSDGPGLTYMIDATSDHKDNAGAAVSRDDRLSVTQLFPTIGDHVGMTIHSSFGAYHLGHVIELSDERLLVRTLGVSEAYGTPVDGLIAFQRTPKGYDVVLSVRQHRQGDWQTLGESTWSKV